MPPQAYPPRLISRITLGAAFLLALQTMPSLHAATYYWDTNNSTAGFGTAGGTWAAPTTNNSTQGWSTNSAGTASLSGTTTTTSADNLYFGTASSPLSAGTVTVSGTVSANQIYIYSPITLSGGTINTGATTVDGGKLVLTSGGAGAYLRDTTVNTGAELELQGLWDNIAWDLTLNGATLTTNSRVQFNSTDVTLSGNSSIDHNGGPPLYIGSPGNSTSGLTGSGTLTIDSVGAIVLRGVSGTSRFDGDMILNTGKIQIQNAGTGGLALEKADLTLNNSSILQLDADGSVKSLAGAAGSSVTLAANTLTIGTNNGTGADFAGAISGTGGLIKTGSGTQTLSGANTYTGTTTINAGTLEIGASGRLNSGSYSNTISNSGTFIYSGTNAQTLSGVISGSGGLTKNASSTLTLSGANTYSGTTTINAGTLTLGANQSLGAIAGAGALNLSSYTLTTNSSSDSTYSGVISGTGALTKNGTGTLTLSNAGNTYTGTTTVNAGTLALGANRNLGAIAGAGALNLASFTLTTNSSSSTTYSGVISGSGALLKDNSGSLTLSGANTYTGATTIESGTLILGAGGTTGSLSTSSSITNNGTLAFNRSDNITQGTHFSTAAIGGTGSIVQNGAGNLTLNAANTYSGATTINAGTI
jgi:fibronectin-binding autotransporter adhesin